MLPVFAVTLGLVYQLARRIGLARWTATVAMVLFGLSPLSVTLNRQIYLDSFAVAWILLALVLAMSPRRHLWHHVAAGAATAIAVLSKETILVCLPAVALALWRTTKGGPRAYSCAGYAAGFILVGLFYPIYALLRGELFPGPGHVSLVGAWQFQLADRNGSGWILAPGTPSNELLHSWLYYDQILPLAGVAATIVGLLVWRLRVPALVSGMLLLMALRPSGYLPAMYVIQLLPFFAVVVAGVAEAAVRRVARLGPREDRLAYRLRTAVLIAASLLAVAVVVPQWSVGLRHALVASDNTRYAAAAGWLRERASIEPHARVVIDDVLWLDAIEAGFDRERVIWFYKLDLDPAVSATLPDGWRDVDYLVSSPAIRADPSGLPTVATLLQRSTVVVSFGAGADRIEIRRIDKEVP
jgi:4-amino-4-deoxy-L-arabinose transferase-like glycosyltransferase